MKTSPLKKKKLKYHSKNKDATSRVKTKKKGKLHQIVLWTVKWSPRTHRQLQVRAPSHLTENVKKNFLNEQKSNPTVCP